MNPDHSSVKVRPVEAGHIPRMIAFLREGFVPHISPEALRRLFEYSWAVPAEKPNLGFALWSGEEVVGFLGAIYAERPTPGGLVKTCNMSTWYVRPDFRWAAMKLLYAVMAQSSYAIINLTPSPGVRRIMEALGFQTIDQRKLVYLPWHYGRGMFRSGPELLTDPLREIAPLLEGDEARFLQDHLPYRLKHYLLREGGEHCYLVMKRRRFPGHAAFGAVPVRKLQLMWYPCMEILYVGNPQLAARCWERFVPAVIRRERVLAVVAAERLFNGHAPAGAQFDHRNYLLPRSPLKTPLDSLYSELAVLPI
jgi:acetoacetyl-CoA synthetase